MTAFDKIKREMDSTPNNAYIQYIGGALLGHLKQNPNDTGKIMDDDKSIAKSLNAMRKEAEKHRVGNCAVLTPEQGFRIVYKYFEIGKEVPIQPIQPVQKPVGLKLNLDDLLKGVE